jgi:LPXTG-motif cell wall-anchored protein
MKRFAYLPLALALTVTGVTGVAYAQGPTTSAPGPSLQREPQPANNDLRNPNSQDQAGSSATTTTTSPSTDTTTTPPPSTDTTTTTPPATTTTTDTTNTTTTTPSSSLPRTGSEMPLVGMIGLLAMGSALGLKAAAKRNA